MKTNEFKSTIENIFSSKGFDVSGKDLGFKGSEACILINIQKFDQNIQYSMNVGFNLNTLDDSVPKRVELSHMYFRLERLFPELREIILDGYGMKKFEIYKPISIK